MARAVHESHDLSFPSPVDSVMMWGVLRDFLPGSSDIDWCETNYVHSSYIAEYYNTVSNVVYLSMPPLLIYLFRPYSKHVDPGINAIWLLLMVVGLGSIYFHATLSFAGQLIDELAIAWVLLAAFAIWTPKHMIPFNVDRKKLSRFMAFLGVVVSVLAFMKPVVNAVILISVTIPASIMIVMEMRRCKDRRAWKICYISLLWLVVAVTLWISDRINCTFWLHIDFPYLHSLWHIFIFLSCYLASVLCAYLYAMQEAASELQPQICYWPVNSFEHGVPYVHITPPSAKYCP